VMKDTTLLIDLLEKLASSLENSNKSDTAKFFSDKAKLIGAVSSDKELENICHELSSSGAISQYANFSYKEDEMFDLIYQRASKTINENK